MEVVVLGASSASVLNRPPSRTVVKTRKRSKWRTLMLLLHPCLCYDKTTIYMTHAIKKSHTVPVVIGICQDPITRLSYYIDEAHHERYGPITAVWYEHGIPLSLNLFEPYADI